MALCNVIELPITSIFPDTQDKSAAAICNAILFPRKGNTEKIPVCLLWYACSMPVKGNRFWRPNHIVPVSTLTQPTSVKRLSLSKVSFQSAKPKSSQEFKEPTNVNWYSFEDGCFDTNVHSGVGRGL